MSWDYRLIRRFEGQNTYYAIHEVYYDANGRPEGVTENEIGVSGETVDETKDTFLLMAEAFNRKVLDWDDIVPIKERAH